MKYLRFLLIFAAIFALAAVQNGHIHAQNAPPTAPSATPAPSQTRKFTLPVKKKTGFVVSTGVYWGGFAADYVTTRRALANNPRAFERNPFARHAAAYWGTAAGVFALTVWLERHHPKLARWVRFGTGGAHFAAAAYNLRQ